MKSRIDSINFDGSISEKASTIIVPESDIELTVDHPALRCFLPIPFFSPSLMDDFARAITKMFGTVSLGAPENAVGFVTWRVMHRYQREVDKGLRPHDLTHLQFITLALVAWMARDGSAATQSQLARFGDIHPMQVSKVLKALEQGKMVSRDPTPSHALAKKVRLTNEGLKKLRLALPTVIEAQLRVFGEEGRPGSRLLKILLRIDQEPILPSEYRLSKSG
jgi:DNA-binding MarR family transcriptional regulator